MQNEMTTDSASTRKAHINNQLREVGWGLLLVFTGICWMVDGGVSEAVWLFGVAGILLGINFVRVLTHIRVDPFSLVLGGGALVTALTSAFRIELPLLAVALIIIGVSVMAKPFLTRAPGSAYCSPFRHGQRLESRYLAADVLRRVIFDV
jgi:hypothetical protein